jgi:hypothetical protein
MGPEREVPGDFVMDKFAELRNKNTNGANYDLDTEDVIERLKKWDAAYGVELSDGVSGHDLGGPGAAVG